MHLVLGRWDLNELGISTRLEMPRDRAQCCPARPQIPSLSCKTSSALCSNRKGAPSLTSLQPNPLQEKGADRAGPADAVLERGRSLVEEYSARRSSMSLKSPNMWIKNTSVMDSHSAPLQQVQHNRSVFHVINANNAEMETAFTNIQNQ